MPDPGEMAHHVLLAPPVAAHVEPVGAAQDGLDAGGDGADILTPGWLITD